MIVVVVGQPQKTMTQTVRSFLAALSSMKECAFLAWKCKPHCNRTADYTIMKDRSKKIIARFIDGEKKLHVKIKVIWNEVVKPVREGKAEKDEEWTAYHDFLVGYFEDDMERMTKAKREITSSDSKRKPSFPKRK